MEIYQLRTFVTVAREGSITRASELLFLSQPAVSAQIKAMEDELGVGLFERTPKGMALTANGARLLAKAEQALAAHRDLLDEAKRLKGRISGTVKVGAVGDASAPALGRLLGRLSERYPEIEVRLRHATSGEVFRGVRDGGLDAGYLIDTQLADDSLRVIELEAFGVYLAIPTAWAARTEPGDWQALAALPWVCPAPDTFCGRVAESLFAEHGIRPQRFVCADQESVTRTLIAGEVGVGLLHGASAMEAEGKGEVVLWQGPQRQAHLMFVHLAKRARDPLIEALAGIVRDAVQV